MENYFDNYFGKTYYINLDSREDKNENILTLFSNLNINNYSKIAPTPTAYLDESIKDIVYASSTKAHLECIQDAIDNNYNRIIIFEDDTVFNQEDDYIKMYIDTHINNCIDFMTENTWDLFYFHNIMGQFFEDGLLVNIARYRKNGNSIMKIKNNPHLHAYAINSNMFQAIIDEANTNFRPIMTILRELKPENVYAYRAGIFDQSASIVSDNH